MKPEITEPEQTDKIDKITLVKNKIMLEEPLDDNDRKIIDLALVTLQTIMYERIPYTPFICGEGGDKGADGMPEFYFVCPTYGFDGSAVYKKHKDYSAPGY